jgi:Ca2+-binding RTX toxin-like protein
VVYGGDGNDVIKGNSENDTLSMAVTAMIQSTAGLKMMWSSVVQEPIL